MIPSHSRPFRYSRALKLYALGVAVLCLSGLAGHLLGHDALYRWVPATVSEKPSTSLALALLSIAANISLYDPRASHLATQATILFVSICAMLTVWCVWPIYGAQPTDEIMTVGYRTPSVATAILVTVVAAWCLIHPAFDHLLDWFVCLVVGGVSAIVLIGHAIEHPGMVFYVPGTSTAMAVSTAAKFFAYAILVCWAGIESKSQNKTHLR